MKDPRIQFLLLAAAVILAGWPATGWRFGADDFPFLRTYTLTPENGVTSVDWGRVLADWTGPWGGNPYLPFYRPLVSTSLALDLSLFGADGGAIAAVNLGIHLLATLLLYLLAREILPGPRSALPAAAFFGLTPLAHENLAWMVGRCGLTVPLGLAAGYFFVRKVRRGDRGLALFTIPLLLAALDLATMESALAWLAFPPACVALARCFRPRDPGSLTGPPLLRLAPPFVALGILYLLWRWVLLGDPASGRFDLLLGEGPLRSAELLSRRFLDSLLPLDLEWLSDPRNLRPYQILGLSPWILGLFAPLHFKDPRSRAYRRACLWLLGFWVLATLPNLNALRLREGLDSARALYYPLPAIALCFGLLATTSRYGRAVALLLPLFFAWNLHFRLERRAHWSSLGLEARLEIGLLAPKKKDRPIAFVNNLNGPFGAPVYQPGEMVLALHPPLLEKRIPALELTRFATPAPGAGEPEWPAAAWIAKACGGLYQVRPAAPRTPGSLPLKVEIIEVPIEGFLDPLRKLEEFDLLLEASSSGLPRPRLPEGWRDLAAKFAATPVLVLAAGPAGLVLPWDGEGWPEAAGRALERWRDWGDEGAAVAVFAALRGDPARPSTTKARSRVRFFRIRTP